MRKLKSTRIWHSGPPPHIGWWNASNCKDVECWRWWDGEQWSVPFYFNANVATINSRAIKPCARYSNVEWTMYWPENARVPRTKL